jgi:hypothetical protein
VDHRIWQVIDVHTRSQAAMEFMMTYGWAILIISVVMAGLYSMGFFSAFSFSPRAQPGSCSIYRPYGAYNNKLIALQGECQGQFPQYVSMFDGKTSFVDAGLNAVRNTGNVTVLLWANVQPPSNTYGPQILQSIDGCVTNGWFFSYQGGIIRLISGTGSSNPGDFSGSSVSQGKWHQLGFTWVSTGASTSTQKIIVDGSVVANRDINIGVPQPRTSNTLIGRVSVCWPATPFNGLLSNIQIYNTSMSDTEISMIYKEGIGGAPLRIQNLVTWWPLNGDANDYSGNGNQGILNSVAFTSTWINTYSPP